MIDIENKLILQLSTITCNYEMCANTKANTVSTSPTYQLINTFQLKITKTSSLSTMVIYAIFQGVLFS